MSIFHLIAFLLSSGVALAENKTNALGLSGTGLFDN
jgi:hypothetical protein